MVSTSKKLELDMRREAVRVLASLGLSYQDIATAMDIDIGSVMNDVKKIVPVAMRFEVEGLTSPQRRDKAFNHALHEWLAIHKNISDYSGRLGVDRDVVDCIEAALVAYLDMRRLNGIAEGVAAFVNTMLYPSDPPEYLPYRQLLMAIFGVVPKPKQKKYSSALEYYFGYFIDGSGAEFTRDSIAEQLTALAMEKFRQVFRAPLGESVKVAVEQALKTIGEREAEVLNLRFGLSGERLSVNEIRGRFSLTKERIRQIEARGLRKLCYPDCSRRLRLFLESPFQFTQRSLEEMFARPTPTPPEVVDVLKLLSQEIEELEISNRAYNALKEMGFQTVGDLVQKTEREMLSAGIRFGFGRKSLNEVKEILKPMGLFFGMKLEGGVPKRPAEEIV